MSGPVTDVSDPGFAFVTSFVIRVIDNAKPGAGVDQFGLALSAAPAPPPPTCTVFTIFTSPIASGDIVVKDALF